MKTSKNCECCSSKSKCIVITIETCCKKNCEEYKKSHGVKIKGDESDRDVKNVSSGPVVMQRSSSGINHPTKASSGVRGTPSSDEVRGAPSSDEVRGTPSSDEVRGAPSSSVRAASSSGVKGTSASSLRKASSSRGLEREDSTKPVDDEKQELVEERSPSRHDSRHSRRMKSRSSVIRSREPRIFKLPLLVERHHGPGCAMEISVLEKHDDTCLYKKEATEGRNDVDDRAGSYDCIGRLVFRTCNTSEAESDTSKLTVHGGSMGPENSPGKNNIEVLHSGTKEKSAEKVLDQDEEGSVHSDQAHFESVGESQLHDLTSKSQDGSFGSAKESFITSSKQEHLMTAKVAAVQDAVPKSKKHYPGDGCKLRPPKTPSFLMNSSVIDQASVSKKVFTVITEKANQTELHTKADIIQDRESSSQETIASLNDLAKPEEKPRRPSFLGALFRRSSAGKSRI